MKLSKNFCPVIFKVFILFLWFALCGTSVLSQENNQPLSDSSGIITIPECLNRLEIKHNVRFYYKTDMFDTKAIHNSVAELPLQNALSDISQLCGLNYLIIDKTSIVFVTKDNSGSAYITDIQTNVITVGNLNEFGKYSKAILSGTITDGASGDPLPGVIVLEEKLKITSFTDQAGHYSMKLPVGEHKLKLKYIGYEDVVRNIKLVSSGDADFSIFEKSLQLPEVEIRDKKADNNLTRSQMGTFQLDTKSIKLMPYTLGETDIIKSVTSLPGVQSPGEFGTGYIVRGGSADQNLILIEDVPLFNSSHLFGLTTAVNPDGISALTLYKDGIPARFGERISSIMTIRLGAEDPKKMKVKGGIGILNSRLSIETPLFNKKANLLIGGRSSYSNWLLHKFPDIDLQNSTAGFYDLNALFTSSMGAKDRISVFGYYSSDKFSFSQVTHYHYSNLLGSIRWNHVFSKKLTSSFVAGLSRYTFGMDEMDTLNIHDARKINFLTDYQTLKWSMSYFPVNRHVIDFGITGILYKNKPGEMIPYNTDSAVEPLKMADEKGLELSAYISDDFEVSDKVSMEAGLRLVNYTALGPGNVFVYTPGLPLSTESITDTVQYGSNQKIYQTSRLEPRLSIRFSINGLSSVKIGFNRMNQFINLISNTSVISPTDVWKLSSTNFLPVTCNQLSIGYFRNFNNNGIETSLALFYKNLSHAIEYKNGALVFLNNHLETDLLEARAYSYGMEIYVKKNSGKLTGYLSYTYSDSKHKTSGTTKQDQINKNNYFASNYDVPNNFVANLNYQISRRWRVSTTFYYNTGRPVTLPELKYELNNNQLIYYSDRNKYRLPDYHRLDISITLDQNLNLRQKWKGSWTLSVINVYGRKNAYSVFYAQQDPRTWNYSASYNLYKMYILGIPLPTITYNFSF